MLELSSVGIHAGVQRWDRQQKSFVETKITKPVPVVKHMDI